jgi:hypothetical protein
MGGVATQSPPAALRRQEAEKAPGWYIPRVAVYKPARPSLTPLGWKGRVHPSCPPPKLKPRAKTWDGVRDGDPQEPRNLGGFAYTAPSLPRRLGIFADPDLQILPYRCN